MLEATFVSQLMELVSVRPLQTLTSAIITDTMIPRLHRHLSQHASSNVTIGMAYELLVLNVLRRYCFHLYHTGKTGDRGRDFIGHWVLPNQRVPVVGQCKHHRRPLRPGDVREFENVLHRRGAHYLTCTGLLVSHSGFSTKAVEMFQSSRVPMMLCQIKFSPHSSLLSSLGSVETSSGNHGNSENEEHHHEGAPLEMETTSYIPTAEMEPTVLEHSHNLNNDGILSEFALNSKAQKMVTNVKVVWRSDSSVVEGRGEVVFLSSVGGKLHNMTDDAQELKGAALTHE